ncbi:hypothetical protein [Pseudonocardia asaccharolytica]|uniref:Lipoprotein n=1 Tax=Pseudonocardia asaccharolytica DSM 44247 = NBRC 16224 TaxID=1123024 RepID=A0A511D545_9PSEU|nr:hypothetical protein [Pseudonocardia asaccharolytica]GEL19919.1 hypothetical protein PA7_37560 [Pseudonocardia asaccharolytica DSM 44247 = NBRC 16224]
MRKILGVGMLLAVLAVSACGGGDPAAGGPPGVREFGLSDADFVAHVERTQSLIADCMKRAGFEYIPVDVATIGRAQESVRKEPGMSRREYKQRWGLSVTTRFDDPVRTIGLGPNVQIMDGLSAADRVAYELTLFGEGRDSDFAFALDEEDFSATGGCTREAVAQVFTPEQLEGTYVNPKDVLVAQDPRVIAAQDEWTRCMQDKGYQYRDDQDMIIEDFQKRLDALLGGDDPETLIGERLTALRALQAEEIAVSLADLDCQERHTDAVFRQVETEVFGRPVSG